MENGNMLTRVSPLDFGASGTIRYKQILYEPNPPLITLANLEDVRRVVPLGSFVVDIGAFIGDTPILYALATGQSGKVVAFEPSGFTRDILTWNVKQNALTQIDIIDKAVMPTAGEYTFHYTDKLGVNGGYSASLDASPVGCGNPIPHNVTAVKLDEFLVANYANWLDRWSFLKIDVEGCDKDLIAANRDLLTRYRPAIQVELYPFSSQRERIQLLNEIEAINYQLPRSRSDLERVDPFPSDILCLPK